MPPLAAGSFKKLVKVLLTNVVSQAYTIARALRQTTQTPNEHPNSEQLRV
jgi:hypothetical protein